MTKKIFIIVLMSFGFVYSSEQGQGQLDQNLQTPPGQSCLSGKINQEQFKPYLETFDDEALVNPTSFDYGAVTNPLSFDLNLLHRPLPDVSMHEGSGIYLLRLPYVSIYAALASPVSSIHSEGDHDMTQIESILN